MNQELQQAEQYDVSTINMVFNPPMLAQMQTMATAMAQSKITIPKHLQGNSADCLAIVTQSMQWRMNPFVVAQKTHLVNGTLGYEAQLVNAVVQQSGFIIGRFHYEYRSESQGLECRVGAVIKGESDITWSEWLASKNITTKNSPLWKTNEKQQLGYLQVKNWSRLYCPGAILGVYSDDELQTEPPEKEINPIQTTQSTQSTTGDAVTDDLIGKLNKNKAEPKPPIEHDAGPDIAEVMAAIAQIVNAETRDKAKALIDQLSEPEKATAIAAYKAKVEEIRSATQANKADPMKYADFEAQVDAATDTDELNTIIAAMPEDAYKALKSMIDAKADALDDPFAVE